MDRHGYRRYLMGGGNDRRRHAKPGVVGMNNVGAKARDGSTGSRSSERV
jgi:hypothetical protein